MNSGWVQQEVEVIKSMEGKFIETIDLSLDLQTELHKLVRLSKRAPVFLSYARLDREIAERIRRALQAHDYSVWFVEAVTPGQDWAAALHAAIDAAVARGFVLVLLSPAALTCQWRERETEYALQPAARSQRCNVIPAPLTVRLDRKVTVQCPLSGM